MLGSGSDIQSPMLQAHPCSSILAKYLRIILKLLVFKKISGFVAYRSGSKHYTVLGSGSDIQSPMLQAHPCSSILAKYFKIILKLLVFKKISGFVAYRSGS